MRTSLQDMTGEELLLVRVLDGPKMQAKIEHELDRRAIGRAPERYDRSGLPSKTNSAHLVAQTT